VNKIQQTEAIKHSRTRLSEKYGYIGWVGHNNLGDEILLEAHRNLLTPGTIETITESKIKWRLKKYTDLIQYNAVILGGGTLIYSTDRRLDILSHYHKKGNKLFAMGTGVEDPSFSKYRRAKNWQIKMRKWDELLKEFSLLGVRGPLSKHVLRKRGIPHAKVVGDTAIALAKDDFKRKTITKNIGINFGISNGNIWGSEVQFIKRMRQLTQTLVRSGYKVLLLPVWHEDYPVNKELYEYVDTRFTGHKISLFAPHGSIDKYTKAVEACDIFIGEKLHSVVISCLTRTPCLMLEYRPKCRDFMESMGLGRYNIRTDQIRIEDIMTKVDRIYSHLFATQRLINSEIMYYKHTLKEFAKRVQDEVS
jgi:polysaccharide pyruvyl transferase WcaK-like protein